MLKNRKASEEATKTKRFKFVTFAEKIANVEIDIFRSANYRLRASEANEKGNESIFSYFSEELRRLKESASMDVDAEWSALEGDLFKLTSTLPLLLRHQKVVVDRLLSSLQRNAGSISLVKGIHRLIMIMARDLRHEFYLVSFPKALRVLVRSVEKPTGSNSSASRSGRFVEAELLESVFTTLAYMFKYLLRSLLENLPGVFRSFAPLLSSKRQYVRMFAAESFAYLVRQVSDKKAKKSLARLFKEINAIYDTYSPPNNNEVVEREEDGEEMSDDDAAAPSRMDQQRLQAFTHGICQTFFHSVKGLKKRFHSNFTVVLPTLLALSSDDSLRTELVVYRRHVICQVVQDLTRWANPDAAQVLFDVLVKHAKGQAQKDPFSSAAYVTAFSALRAFLTTLNPNIPISTSPLVNLLVSSPLMAESSAILWSAWFAVVLALIRRDISFSAALLSTLSSAKAQTSPVARLWALCRLCPSLTLLTRFARDACLALPLSGRATFVNATLKCIEVQLTSENFFALSVPLADMLATTRTTQLPSSCALNHAQSASDKDGEGFTGNESPVAPLSISPLIELSSGSPLLAEVEHLLYFAKEIDASSFYTALQIASRVKVPSISKRFYDLVDRACSSIADDRICAFIIAALLECVLLQDAQTEINMKLLSTLRHRFSTNASLLRIACRLLDAYKFNAKDLKSLFKEDFVAALNENLSGNSTQLRDASLSLLRAFAVDDELAENKDVNRPPARSLVDICLAIERSSTHAPLADLLPGKVSKLRESLAFRQQRGALSVSDLILVLKYAQGIFSIRYRPAWLEAQRTLELIASMNPSLFWEHTESTWSELLTNSVFSSDESEPVPLDIDVTRDPRSEANDEEISTPLPPVRSLHSSAVSPLELPSSRFESAITMQLRERIATPLLNRQSSLWATFIAVARQVEAFVGSLLPQMMGFMRLCGGKKLQSGLDEDILALAALQDVDFDENDPEANVNAGEDAPTEASVIQSEAGRHRRVAMNLLEQSVRFVGALARPFNLDKATQLYELLKECLSLDTPHVPHLALEAMLKWKNVKDTGSEAEIIARYSSPLLALADEDTARDTMLQWSINGDDTTVMESTKAPNEDATYPVVDAQDRRAVASIIIRLIAPRLTSRRHTHGRRGGHKAQVMHQNSILDFLARLGPEDIDIFLEYLIAPVKAVMESKELKVGVLYGFLQLQHSVLGRLSPVLSHESLHEIVNLTISIARAAKTDISSENVRLWKAELSKNDRSQLSRIRHLAIQRIAETISRFPNFDIREEKWSEMTAVIESEVSVVKESDSALLSLSTLRWLSVVTSTRSLALHLHNERGEVLIGTTLRLVSRPAGSLGGRGPQSNDLLLALVENLLRLRLEPEGDEEVLDLISPHLTTLLSALQARLFASTASTEAPRMPMSKKSKNIHIKSLNHESSLRQLRLLSALSQIASDLSAAQANQLLQLLVPLLRQRTLAEASRTLLFSIFGHVLPFASAPASHLPFLSQLFATLSTRQSRTALCEILGKLAELDASLRKVAELAATMNSYSTKVVDEYDYERRLDGFNAFLTALKENDRNVIAAPLLPPLIHNFFYFLSDADLSIRSQSAHCLAQLIKFMADAPDRLPRSLLTQLVVPHLKKLLSSNTVARTEAIGLFGRLIALFPAQFSDLQVLVGKDDDSNFFINVAHLQVHRRVRAYQKLAQIIQSRELSGKSINQIVLPLAWQCVVSVTSDDQGLAEAAMLVLQATAGVSSWKDYERLLLQTIRSLPRYPDFEKRLLRLAQLLSEKIIVYLTQIPAAGDAMNVNAEDEQDENDDDFDQEDEEDDNDQVQDVAVEENDTVLRSVRTTMIPRVQSWLSSRKDTPALAMATASVLVQLLRTLPASHMAKHLPALLGEICELLVSRVQLVRNTARECLVNVTTTLGTAATLAPVLHELERRLARGFQLHVLGYTLHILLLNIAPLIQESGADSVDAEALRDSVPLLMKLLLRDYLDLSEQKSEDRTIKLMKEGKRSRVPQSLEILTSAASPSVLPEIIRPVAHALVVSYNPARVNKLVTLLHHIHIGAVKNVAFTLLSVMPYLCDLVESNLPRTVTSVIEPTAIDKARTVRQARLIVSGAERRDRGRLGVDPAEAHLHPENMPAKKTSGLKSVHAAERTLSILRGERGEKEYERSARRGGESDEEHEENCSEEEEEPEPSDSSNHHHIVAWALSFVQARLKAQRNLPWTEEVTNALTPLIPLLNRCISLRQSGPAMTTLKVYVALLGCPRFTALQQSSSVASVTNSTFKLLKSSGTTSSLGEQCLRVLSTIIRDHNAHAKLSENKLKFLLDYLASHLIEGGAAAPVVGRRWTDKDTAIYKGEAQTERTAMALTLLKAIVNAKIVLPGVYDIMKHLLPLIVHTEAGSVRALASSILVQFMLTYPLGSKRVQQSIDAIVANLQFELPRGRMSVLEIIQTLTQRLPAEFISPRAASFYLPLVLVLVNDDDRDCRVKAASALQQLCKSITNEALSPLVELTFNWAEGGDNVSSERVTAGVHVLSLLVEAVPDSLLRRMTRLFAVVRNSIDFEAKQLDEMAAADLNSLTELEADELSDYPWQRTYYSVLLLEKLATHRPSLFESDWFAENVWPLALSSLMLHPHLWVRSCVDRLLGRYFGYCSDRAPFSSGSDVHAKSALWLSQNGVMFELAATLCKQLQSRMLDDALAEQIVKNLVFLSTQLLRLPHLTPADAITKSNGDVAEDERDADAPSISGERAPLHWLVRRLSFMARKAAAKNHIRTRSILQYFGVIGTQVLSGEVLSEFLVPMLHPIYRISIMEAGFRQEALEANIGLAAELIELLRSGISQNVYFAAYEEVRMDVNKKRLKRKREAAEEAVANPELHARKKLKHNQLKVQSRKRKNQFYSVNKTPLKVSKTRTDD